VHSCLLLQAYKSLPFVLLATSPINSLIFLYVGSYARSYWTKPRARGAKGGVGYVGAMLSNVPTGKLAADGM
jgi:hypothetical protein